MILNLRNLLNGTPVRLRYVFRYSTSRVQHPESVAEHSFYVAFYAMCIADWFGSTVDSDWFEQNVQVSLLLRRALVHDLEEARSGDMPRPFKHSDQKLKEMLEVVAEHALEQVADEMSDNPVYTTWMKKLWSKAKDDSYEGRIIQFADFLSVLSFMMQEKSSGGNLSIASHVKDMDKYFELFAQEKFNFIRPLVDQAADAMKELFHEDHKSLREAFGSLGI